MRLSRYSYADTKQISYTQKKTMGKLYVSPSFLLLWSFLFFFDSDGWLPFVIVVIVIHEMGHYIALRLCGKQMVMLRFSMFGLEMQLSDEPPISWIKDLLITLAGPAAGLLAGLIAWILHIPQLVAVSVSLTAINLLPTPSRDGGRALILVTTRMFGKRVGYITGQVGLWLCRAGIAAAVCGWLWWRWVGC